MGSAIPFFSHEVRWFFEGTADDHPSLKRWFESAAPVPKAKGASAPVWKGRLDDKPDCYLVVPGADDMGIKWREGEFQVKGRVASLGMQVFAGGHQGDVERWVKWSYEKLPDAYRELFTGKLTIPVKKTRALRKVHLDTFSGALEEVDAGALVDRGVGIELTNLVVAEKPYCSLAFEAFPDDSALHASFSAVVSAFLATLPNDVRLAQSDSLSYPGWLSKR